MEPLSDGVEVAFTVTTVHDHRTASQVPCARRRRRDGATETMGRLSFESRGNSKYRVFQSLQGEQQGRTDAAVPLQAFSQTSWSNPTFLMA